MLHRMFSTEMEKLKFGLELDSAKASEQHYLYLLNMMQEVEQSPVDLRTAERSIERFREQVNQLRGEAIDLRQTIKILEKELQDHKDHVS